MTSRDAGIVPDLFQMSFRTDLHMTTEKRGATRQDGLNRTTNISRQRMTMFVYLLDWTGLLRLRGSGNALLAGLSQCLTAGEIPRQR
jgi:hypothetical protein